MPPKKQGPKKEPKGPSAKTVNKEKGKVLEDKTFGLKNKNKSMKVQAHIKEVTNQIMVGDAKGGRRAQENAEYAEKAQKQKTAAQKALLASLFKGVVQIQTAEDGTIDKKNSLCAYFKAGVCEKGKKCKYSHDLTLEDTRAMAIDLYSDPRVKSGKAPDTIITCRDFIEAVEKELYGFNWVCPNQGDNCCYRHMLPQGYVLNRDKGGQDSSDDEMTLEEKIEEERALLIQDELTPVTLETFTKWKADRAQRKLDEIDEKIAAEVAKGRRDKAQMNFMSGRALFQYNPDMFDDADDEDAADDTIFDEDFDGFENQEERKAGAAQQDVASDDDNEERKNRPLYEEESKEEVKVDQNLFAAEAEMDEEEPDFD